MNVRITDIVWDTDGETVDLPEEVTVDAAAEGIDDVDAQMADWLSDKYGWCVTSYAIERTPAPRP